MLPVDTNIPLMHDPSRPAAADISPEAVEQMRAYVVFAASLLFFAGNHHLLKMLCNTFHPDLTSRLFALAADTSPLFECSRTQLQTRFNQ
jgi:hypothetical protein